MLLVGMSDGRTEEGQINTIRWGMCDDGAELVSARARPDEKTLLWYIKYYILFLYSISAEQGSIIEARGLKNIRGRNEKW